MTAYVPGLLLIFFAAVHGGYEPTPHREGALSYWQGRFGRSWLLSPHLPAEPVRIIANLLWVLPLVGFIAAGLSLFGWLVPHDLWPTLTLSSAAGSLLLALLYWHPYQWTGALGDAVIVAAVLLVAPPVAVPW